jgi:hypothetical protein
VSTTGDNYYGAGGKHQPMKKFTIFSIFFSLLFPSPAFAINMKFSIEVHVANGDTYEKGESRPSIATMQKDMLKYCKTEYEDFNVGSTIKAVSGSGGTVGLGKVTSVKIGKVYKKEIRLYVVNDLEEEEYGYDEDDAEEEDEGTLHDQYFAPCIFSGSIANLRNSAFYKFYIGSVRTAEYDSKDLQKKKWNLNLWISEIGCYSYEESWFGCYEE